MKFRGSPPTHTHTLPDLLERKAALLFLLRHLHRCCCFGGHMSALPSENYTAAVHYFWSSGRRREVWALVEGGTCWKVLQHTPACGPMVERHHMVLKNNWDPSSLPLLFFFLCVCGGGSLKQIESQGQRLGDQKVKACVARCYFCMIGPLSV